MSTTNISDAEPLNNVDDNSENLELPEMDVTCSSGQQTMNSQSEQIKIETEQLTNEELINTSPQEQTKLTSQTHVMSEPQKEENGVTEPEQPVVVEFQSSSVMCKNIESNARENAGILTENDAPENAWNVTENDAPENAGILTENDAPENAGIVIENDAPEDAGTNETYPLLVHIKTEPADDLIETQSNESTAQDKSTERRDVDKNAADGDMTMEYRIKVNHKDLR